MRLIIYSIFILVQIYLSLGKERYNPLSDFILHEANGGVTPFNKDSNTQFPALKPVATPAPSTVTETKLTNNKRDYVAPQFPTLKPVTTSSTRLVTHPPSQTPSTQPKRDYVAPQYPTLKPHSPTPTKINVNTGTTPKISAQPKRDYVAPGFTTPKPINAKVDQPGKVKDLVNFFDGKNQPNTPQVPSYSSILKGSTGTSQPVTPSGQKPYTKPGSFSSVVSDSNNNKPTLVNTNNKNKQTTNIKPVVLPSSVVNSNNNGGSNTVTDSELQELSEELLKKDVNNAAKYLTINYQSKTSSQSKDDKATLPLLTISPDVWNLPTIQKFVPLLDNYERDSLVNEYVTAQERNEENAFMDAIMSTSVIRYLMNFLKEKGYVTQDPRQQRDYLKQMWFGLYSRGKGKISSSGFEHVFVSELKNDQISGLHNWIYFSKEEAANRVNYLGYLKYTNLGDKGAVLKLHFNNQGIDKPVGTMFIGTSPELEMALYTLCYVTRVEKDCKLKLANNEVDIVTYNFRYRSKNYIGSAYPQI